MAHPREDKFLDEGRFPFCLATEAQLIGGAGDGALDHATAAQCRDDHLVGCGALAVEGGDETIHVSGCWYRTPACGYPLTESQEEIFRQVL